MTVYIKSNVIYSTISLNFRNNQRQSLEVLNNHSLVITILVNYTFSLQVLFS